MVRLVVDSPDPGAAEFLRRRLDPRRFRITGVAAGVDFDALVRRERPHIAVIDQVHVRLDAARDRIAVLKEACPGVRVIAVSESPSPRDGRIVEQGVFFYLTLAVGEELIRIIEAGAEALRTQASGPGGRREDEP